MEWTNARNRSTPGLWYTYPHKHFRILRTSKQTYVLSKAKKQVEGWLEPSQYEFVGVYLRREIAQIAAELIGDTNAMET